MWRKTSTSTTTPLNRLYTSLKDTPDPAGTLSPGNHGIWPSSAGRRLPP
jgi:hypothetical protein